MEYRRRVAASSYTLHDVANAINADARLALVDQSKRYQELEDKLALLQQRLGALGDRLEAPKFVVNTSSGVFHRADTHNTSGLCWSEGHAVRLAVPCYE